jgi:hypothetical protein
MDQRVRLTPLGAVLLGLGVVAIVAVVVGSTTVQAIGLVVVVLVVLFVAADQLPLRTARGGPISPDRADGLADGRAQNHAEAARLDRAEERRTRPREP